MLLSKQIQRLSQRCNKMLVLIIVHRKDIYFQNIPGTVKRQDCFPSNAKSPLFSTARMSISSIPSTGSYARIPLQRILCRNRLPLNAVGTFGWGTDTCKRFNSTYLPKWSSSSNDWNWSCTFLYIGQQCVKFTRATIQFMNELSMRQFKIIKLKNLPLLESRESVKIFKAAKIQKWLWEMKVACEAEGNGEDRDMGKKKVDKINKSIIYFFKPSSILTNIIVDVL